MADALVRLTLEFEPGADRVRGWLREASGQHWRFEGWLEFVQALDEVIATSGPGTGRPVDPDGGGDRPEPMR